MENYNDEIFGFGAYENGNSEQIDNFNYDSISGLGQSDYENEDLFNTEVESSDTSVFDGYYNLESINPTNDINSVGVNYVENNELYNSFSNEVDNQNPFIQNFGVSDNAQAVPVTEESLDNFVQGDSFEELVNEPSVINNNADTVEKMNFDPMTGEPLNSLPVAEQPVVNLTSEMTEEKVEPPNIFDAPIFVEPQVEVLPEVEQPIMEEYSQIFEPPVAVAPEILEENVQPTIDPLVMEKPAFEETPMVEGVEEEKILPAEGPELLFEVEAEGTPKTLEENVQPTIEPLGMESPAFEETPVTEGFEEETILPAEESESLFEVATEEIPETLEDKEEPIVDDEGDIETPQEKIEISDTTIEQLNKLTEYEEEKIEETDINALFDKVSVNFKDASDIFRRNSDLKHKIDVRFEELKKLQSGLENARKKQLDEINNYKAEVLEKLTEKKEEIERRLNVLKESQATFEREKKEFEVYKKKEQDNIDRVQKEVQSAYDDRREELNYIEDVLRKQKDSLDEERSQLSLDRIQYESDKNELANNLLKFNELVNSFTNGVNDIQE